MDGMEMGEGTRDVILLVSLSPDPSTLSPRVRIADFQAHRLKKLFRLYAYVPTKLHLNLLY